MGQKTTIQQILWGVLFAGFLGGANAADFTVNQLFDGVDANPGDGTCATASGNCTLRAAVMETNALAGADTITIPAGTYNMVLGNTGEDLAAEGDLDILDDLTITGADPATTILSGNTNQFRVLSVLKRADNTLPVVSISNITLTQGMAGTFGAALYNEGVLALENVTIDNASVDTAPVYNNAGNLSVNNSRITNNVSGIYTKHGNLSINNSTFDGNIYTGNTLFRAALSLSYTNTSINNSSFSSNANSLNGGSIYNRGSELTIDNSQFNGNTTGGSGGAIYAINNSQLKVSNSSFDSNSATGTSSRGGALYLRSSSTITDTTITNNSASNQGGGIYARGTAVLKRVTLTGNQATVQDGGAAFMDADYGSVDISDSIIRGNSAADVGGGLALIGDNPTSVRHTEISANSAASGGGVFTSGSIIQLENITISGNSASVDGGGLYHSASGTGSVQLTHVTLSANTAPDGMGGNITNAAGSVRLANTLIAAAGNGFNCNGTITTLGYNLNSGNNNCGLGAEGDLRGTDPLLDALANNGGTTKTHALLAGSPAIDAGNSTLCANRNGLDQRYYYRGDGACDIGAYEAGSARAQSGTLAFSVANMNVGEADGTATVTVSRTGGSEGDVATWVEDLLTGTASTSYPYGYSTIPRTKLQWPNGDAEDKTVEITLNDNRTIDGDKTINLTLDTITDGGAAIGSQNTTTVTIVDDESIPGDVSFDAATYAIAENGYVFEITVNRANGNAAVSIDYATSDDTAIAGTDYTAASGTLNFGIGQTSKTIRVYVTNNSIYEGDKTFNITLSNPQGGVSLGQWTSSVVTIQDDEAQPDPSTISFDVASVNVGEAGASVTVNLTRTGSTTGTVTVDYATTDGTATAGSDYTAGTGTITFNANVTSRSITLYITDDAITEGAESFTVSLSNPLGGASLGTIQTMTVNIQDNDAGGGGTGGAGELRFGSDIVVNESDGTATVTVSRINGSTGSVSVDYVTNVDFLPSGLLPATIGSDYSLTAGTLTFADGVTSQTITFSIIDDSLVEGDENFWIDLQNPTGGAILGTESDSYILITIIDNDTTTVTNPGVISVESSLYPSSENNSTVTYALTRTGGTDGVVSVVVTFEDGSAVFGTDYNASSQSYTATFQDGESRITGTVSIIDDSSVELEESFGIRLSNPQGGATLGTIEAAAFTIADNDSSGSGGGSSSTSSGGGGGATSPLLLLGGLLLAPVIRRRNKQ